jgi:hypothetical protein
MTTYPETFYGDLSDCEWLRDTHLKHVVSALSVPEFHSFTLQGNEDCPQIIRLYLQREPEYTDSPIAVYVLDGDSHPFVWRDEMITDGGR